MSAARTLGWPQVGLAAILDTHFGVKMSKKYQRADWKRRPLTPEQLDYARLDTHYLVALRDRQLEALTESGRWTEAHEEFERLARPPWRRRTTAGPAAGRLLACQGCARPHARAGRCPPGTLRLPRTAGRAHRPSALHGDGRGDAAGACPPRSASRRRSAGPARHDAGANPPPRRSPCCSAVQQGLEAPPQLRAAGRSRGRRRAAIGTTACTPGARTGRRRAASSRMSSCRARRSGISRAVRRARTASWRASPTWARGGGKRTGTRFWRWSVQAGRTGAIDTSGSTYAFNCRAMNALTISRALSVCGPGFATHSCSQPSNTLVLTVAAGGLVGRGELLLRGRQHVVVERALHDQQRHQRDLLAPLEDLLRIALVDRLPRLEERLVCSSSSASRFSRSAFWKRANGLLTGERIAT